MKHLRLSLPDELHVRLQNLTTHHGHLSHMLRSAIEKFVELEEKKRSLKRGIENAKHPTCIS